MSSSTRILAVLLAITDQGAKTFKAGVDDYKHFFSKEQGQFKGEQRTYLAADGTIDEPTKRGVIRVATTVDEKIEWFINTHSAYVDNLFSVEATNASNTARAELKVGDISFGTFSSLELLRLNSLLDDASLKAMYATIPVRADNQIWKATENEIYVGREGIWETPLVNSVNRSTVKGTYILPDPNVDKLKEGVTYTAKTAENSTVQELGKGTSQSFSGEYTHRQRAEILKRIGLLKQACVESLKVANQAPTITSEMTAQKLFGFLHTGAI